MSYRTFGRENLDDDDYGNYDEDYERLQDEAEADEYDQQRDDKQFND